MIMTRLFYFPICIGIFQTSSACKYIYAVATHCPEIIRCILGSKNKTEAAITSLNICWIEILTKCCVCLFWYLKYVRKIKKFKCLNIYKAIQFVVHDTHSAKQILKNDGGNWSVYTSQIILLIWAMLKLLIQVILLLNRLIPVRNFFS